MNNKLENLQINIKKSLDYVVSLDNIISTTYAYLQPSEKALQIYGMLLAVRNLDELLKEAQSLQKLFIPNVTNLKLVEARKALLGVLQHLILSSCCDEICYVGANCSTPVYGSRQIVEEENAALHYPTREHQVDYTAARRLLIDESTGNYAQLESIIRSINERLDSLLEDVKHLRHNKVVRMDRMCKMKDYYLQHLWENDRQLLVKRVMSELSSKKNLTELEVLNLLLKDIVLDKETNKGNKRLGSLNHHWEDQEKVAGMMVEHSEKLTVGDMMEHFKYIESMKFITHHINAKMLLVPCSQYQGKLFVNEAAHEFAKLIRSAVARYVGFENKINAAFFFYALRDTGLVYANENNAKLMAEFMSDEYGEEISSDTLTRPLRKCSGWSFCKINETQLRDFTANEFEKYKDTYWRCFSIINKVLQLGNLDCAEYLKWLHPVIETNHVFDRLDEVQLLRLYYLSGVLRRESLLF